MISCLVAGVSVMIIGCSCPFKKCHEQKSCCPSQCESKAQVASAEGQSCEK